jgi:hypothetical protein
MEEDEDEAANLVQYVVRYFIFLMLPFDLAYDLLEGQRKPTSSC